MIYNGIKFAIENELDKYKDIKTKIDKLKIENKMYWKNQSVKWIIVLKKYKDKKY